MWRLGVLVAVVLIATGCAADRAEWEEVMKDLRGDNMKMRSNFGGTGMGSSLR